MLDNYKVILWDFDGVILDSNAVRDLGFKKVLSAYPDDQVNELMRFHHANGGLSRYVKFRFFFEEVLGLSISDEELLKLANSFSEIMKSMLVNPNLLILDSVNFIKHNFEKYKMHIVSGSDQTELRFLCAELKLTSYFHSIHGSPTAKKVLVKNVLHEFKYDVKDCILIGDSINDYEASKDNGIDFAGYNNIKLMPLGNYIKKF
jgi:phosphoglycolate phosphatase-like HAD superfamily hydrolase